MAFAGGPQTHDKPEAAFFKVALIRMGHNGRVEKSRRLYGIFFCKIRADQFLLNIFQQYLLGQEILYPVQVPFKDMMKVFVPARKIPAYFGHQIVGKGIGQIHDAPDNSGYATGVIRKMRPCNDPGYIPDDLVGFSGHFQLNRMFCLHVLPYVNTILRVKVDFGRYPIAGRGEERQSDTRSSIFAVPAHMTVSAPPQ